ncbi:MAG: YfcE family phosphodiesterase [Dehalococcoidia bacterium]
MPDESAAEQSPWIARHQFHGDMRIGLVSDTHIPEARKTLWDELYGAFDGVDLILHAGDMHSVVVLDWLERVAPVLAVRGNGDDGSGGRPVAPPDPRLAHQQVLEVDGLTIGMTHDFSHLELPGASFERRMERLFEGAVDIVVAGDTHVPIVTETHGVMIVNSGSPTYPRNLQTQLGTVGFMEIRGGEVDAWIEQLH